MLYCFAVGSSIRQHGMMDLKRKYKTEAEHAMGITVEHYLEESPGRSVFSPDDSQTLNMSAALLGKNENSYW